MFCYEMMKKTIKILFRYFIQSVFKWKIRCFDFNIDLRVVFDLQKGGK